jgi:hypothetical protein
MLIRYYDHLGIQHTRDIAWLTYYGRVSEVSVNNEVIIDLPIGEAMHIGTRPGFAVERGWFFYRLDPDEHQVFPDWLATKEPVTILDLGQ